MHLAGFVGAHSVPLTTCWRPVLCPFQEPGRSASSSVLPGRHQVAEEIRLSDPKVLVAAGRIAL